MKYKIDNPLNLCDLKFDEGETGEFSGYASTFGNVDSYRDTIEKGAYKDSIKNNKKIPMLINHQTAIPVGDWVSLKEDNKGLQAVGKIDFNHIEGRSLHSALKRGAMDALSVGFIIPKGGAIENDDGIRIISKIDLKEISVVNFPADDSARISVVKSEIQYLETLKDFEMFLRDTGTFSRSTAMAFVSRLKNFVLRDAEIKQEKITMLEKQLQGKDATRHLVELINKL